MADAVLMPTRYASNCVKGIDGNGSGVSAFDDPGRMLYKIRELEPPGSGNNLAKRHSSVAQWQSFRLLTEGL